MIGLVLGAGNGGNCGGAQAEVAANLAWRQSCHCAGGGSILRGAPAALPMGWFSLAVVLFRWFRYGPVILAKTGVHRNA